MNKNEIRKAVLKRRNETVEKKKKSDNICRKVINSAEYKRAEVVACYLPIGSEVITSLLINDALLSGKKIALPKTEGENMRFFEYKEGSVLKEGNFGVFEPVDTSEISPADIDLFIVPGVAFDKEGNRIGYGKGYYDKYMKDTCKTKIGLAFKTQMVDHIKSEQNDIKMDKVVTEDTDEKGYNSADNFNCGDASFECLP